MIKNRSLLRGALLLLGLFITGCPKVEETTNLSCGGNTSDALAITLWNRVAGPYRAEDQAKLLEVKQLLSEGKALEAGRIMVAQKGFVDYTMKTLTDRLITLDNTPFLGSNDNNDESYNAVTAFLQGLARDDRSIREMVTADDMYIVREDIPGGAPPKINIRNNNHWDVVRTRGLSAHDVLVARGFQWDPVEDEVIVNGQLANDIADAYRDYSGMLTLDSPLSVALFNMGTNRRFVQWVLDQLLGWALEKAHDTLVGQFYVGPDVDRTAVVEFSNNCVGCHGAMDAMRAATAYITAGGNLQLRDSVQTKFNQNSPYNGAPYRTTTRFWVNLYNRGANQEAFGWRGPSDQGTTLNSLMQLVANSEAYTNRMVLRAFHQVHLKDPLLDEEMAQWIKATARAIEAEGDLTFKNIFAHVVAAPQCAGQGE